MSDSPTENGRNPDGTFAAGNPGGPGRPQGSVSVIAKIKRKFEENPDYFDEWISKFIEDPAQRRAIMEQIDGKPVQPISGANGGAIQIELVKYAKDTDTS